ncbi:hypothetical protein AGOR_G00141480 [Albula goreensis]|uniref:Uncharacterized protein n=1 Tax=Albula goreensis TaxID=1534307 RepID=A0A8T3D6D2_9TELE|nr:hypothetical protein AGOR_G00141480 [Albula goreensis]
MREEMEHRQREEEEQRKREAERRKEERRQKRERELEKQRRVEREQQLQVRAAEHHRRALLLHHGLAPWKRLLEKGHAHIQLAQDHHRVWLLRHCLLSWMQAAVESQAEKEACADRLYQHTLLRRSLHCWHSLLGHAVALEMQAERFCRIQTLRRTLRALLDHVTEEKFAAWDREEQARQHWHRCVVRRCLWAWQRLPSLLREEQEREERREQLRRRVAEILPDFRCSAARGAWGLSPP